MEVGIIGLPKSGKTTIFNALTKAKIATSVHPTPAFTPHLGVAKVPDYRLQILEKTFNPKKVIPAEVKYIDIAGVPKDFGKGEGIKGQFLTHLMNVDALLQVVRVFDLPEVPHIEGSIDPKRDIAILNLELIFSDLVIIEKRLQRLESSLKGAKSLDRDQLMKEKALLEKLKAGLETDKAVREQSLTQDEIKSLANYQFLTAKPMLLILNIGENQLSQASFLEAEIYSLYPQLKIVALCGKLEAELAQLGDTEAEEFRKALGVPEPAIDRVVRFSYQLLGLITFFTVVSDELKAWAIPQGTPAIKAAGKIHSDIERGFIKAEVVSFHDFEKCGSLAEARKRGLLRLEGKNYIVQDGDIITFLFNV